MSITIFSCVVEDAAGRCEQCQTLANSDDLQNCPCGKTICPHCVRRGHTHHQLAIWQDVGKTTTAVVPTRWQAPSWVN